VSWHDSRTVQGGLISLHLSFSSRDKEETETKRPQTKSGFRISDDRTRTDNSEYFYLTYKWQYCEFCYYYMYYCVIKLDFTRLRSGQVISCWDISSLFEIFINIKFNEQYNGSARTLYILVHSLAVLSYSKRWCEMTIF